ncbi:MAG TPA: serine protease, partial [Epsilonproteobacteria bacterium]|nr:serine protease [Campylobacterota bacterium]
MQKIIIVWTVLFGTLFAQGMVEESKQAIVKIYTVSKTLNYQQPWSSSMRSSTGSGAIIKGVDGKGEFILTNAHVVANHTFLEVQRYGERKRY